MLMLFILAMVSLELNVVKACLRAHSHKVAELGFELRPDSKAYALPTHYTILPH